MNCQNKKNYGFTILELTVSAGLLAALAVSAISIMIAVSKAQTSVERSQSAIDNIRFSLELITKEMRVGTDYASFSCSGFSGITFTTSAGDTRIYYLDTAQKQIMRSKTNDCDDAVQFTSEEIQVERFGVILRGHESAMEDGQPWATISLRVTVPDPKGTSGFSMDLQTSVVQRIRDYY